MSCPIWCTPYLFVAIMVAEVANRLCVNIFCATVMLAANVIKALILCVYLKFCWFDYCTNFKPNGGEFQSSFWYYVSLLMSGELVNESSFYNLAG